jgi:hypothetical protein
MWDKGHSMEEIRAMSLQDFGDVLGYWNEKNRAEEKLSKRK